MLQASNNLVKKKKGESRFFSRRKHAVTRIFAREFVLSTVNTRKVIRVHVHRKSGRWLMRLFGIAIDPQTRWKYPYYPWKLDPYSLPRGSSRTSLSTITQNSWPTPKGNNFIVIERSDRYDDDAVRRPILGSRYFTHRIFKVAGHEYLTKFQCSINSFALIRIIIKYLCSQSSTITRSLSIQNVFAIYHARWVIIIIAYNIGNAKFRCCCCCCNYRSLWKLYNNNRVKKKKRKKNFAGIFMRFLKTI